MSVPPSAREEAEANAAMAAMIADAAASGEGGWVTQMLRKYEPLAAPVRSRALPRIAAHCRATTFYTSLPCPPFHRR